MLEKKKKEIIKDVQKNIFRGIKKIRKRIPRGEKKKIASALRELNKNMSSLYYMATRDDKTGLYNMRFFNAIFEHEVERSKRYDKELSIIIIDADNFKQVNDRYGHKKGDYVLIKIARLIKEDIRKSDVLSRFGGEEFVILLPNTDIRKAFKIAERVRKKIILDKNLSKFGITISLGVSHFESEDTTTSLFEKADKALLSAKKGGKNKSVILSEMDIPNLNKLASLLKITKKIKAVK